MGIGPHGFSAEELERIRANERRHPADVLYTMYMNNGGLNKGETLVPWSQLSESAKMPWVIAATEMRYRVFREIDEECQHAADRAHPLAAGAIEWIRHNIVRLVSHRVLTDHR